MQVCLTAENGKSKKLYVHRLVALAFIPNPAGLPQINHKDENKKNNHIKNLEWISVKDNSNYGTRNERISKANSIPVYCVELNKVFWGSRNAANELGISHIGIIRCCKGKYKSTHGYHFRYAEVGYGADST